MAEPTDPKSPAEGGDAPAPDRPAVPDGEPAPAPAPVMRDAEKAPAATKTTEAAASVEARPEAEAAPSPAAAKPGAVAAAPSRADQVKAELAAEAAKVAGRDKPKPAPKPKPEPEDELPEPPPWYRTLRADPPAYTRAALGIGLVAMLLLLWWFVTRGSATERIISPSRLPSPGEVFGSFGRLLDRDLTDSILDTLERVFKGVGLAAVVGVSVGVIAAAHRGVAAALAPLVIFLRSVPMGALIPLTLLLFTQPERQKTMFLFFALVAFVFSDTVKAISIVPERYVETAQTLGASRFQIIRKVLVPLALPDIITSLRFQLGLALGYVMLVEVIDAEHGLGKLINMSERQGPYEHVYLLLFVIALIAFGLDLLLRTLQRGAFAWRKDL